MTPMLLPLDTLPGWPTAETPSTAWLLVLCIGLPLLTGLVFTLIGFARKLGKDHRTHTVDAGIATETALDQASRDDALELAAQARAGRVNATGRRNAIVS
ncbi:MAG TPA: hypothetical protein PKN27_07645 [Propionibacteriaceae bacterium]|nr:hypothetical protein [Propionibacteriaceae bacterium]